MIRTRLGGALGGLAGLLLMADGAAACPDWRYAPDGQQIVIDGSLDEQAGRGYRVWGGGSNRLEDCDMQTLHEAGSPVASRPGRFASVPDFELRFRAYRDYRLELAVESDCAAPLLINTGRRSWHWDNGNGAETPRIGPLNRPLSAYMRLAATAESVIDIWVGAHGVEACDALLFVRAQRK